ncbi:hypothetical protein CCACVL1_02033, partial [Corchorus capsularis]
ATQDSVAIPILKLSLPIALNVKCTQTNFASFHVKKSNGIL